MTYHLPNTLFNVHNGKRDVRRAARIATLAVDQGGVESTAEVVSIKDSPKKESISPRDRRRIV